MPQEPNENLMCAARSLYTFLRALGVSGLVSFATVESTQKIRVLVEGAVYWLEQDYPTWMGFTVEFISVSKPV